MATDTMPRAPGTIRQAPGRGRRTPPGGRTPPGRTVPPGRRTQPRGSRPQQPRPVTAPRHTRPVTGAKRTSRMPFILLLVGLLGGALVTLLVISTTLAEGSFQITSLQQQNTTLARQEQILAEQVAQAQSPAQIAQEAERLGMRRDPYLRFIDLKTGKIVTGKVSRSAAEINVPGYTP
jgi:cell division protein FtsB